MTCVIGACGHTLKGTLCCRLGGNRRACGHACAAARAPRRGRGEGASFARPGASEAAREGNRASREDCCAGVNKQSKTATTREAHTVQQRRRSESITGAHSTALHVRSAML